jgi:hypothetical protein
MQKMRDSLTSGGVDCTNFDKGEELYTRENGSCVLSDDETDWTLRGSSAESRSSANSGSSLSIPKNEPNKYNGFLGAAFSNPLLSDRASTQHGQMRPDLVRLWT